MNKITFPLKLRMKGPAVADLQAGLQLCLERRLILADDEDARRQLFQALQRERSRQTYGHATRKLVSLLRELHRLRPTGSVDEPTANALNTLLEENGLLEPTAPEMHFVVSGSADSHELRGLPGLRVVVVDKNILRDDSVHRNKQRSERQRPVRDQPAR